MCIDRDQVNEWISPFIAGAKRSPQPESWLGQRHFINYIARFFSICSHSWDSVVLPTNMHGIWMSAFFTVLRWRCVSLHALDLYGENTYRFCNIRKRKDFNLKKKQLTLHKLCVISLLCGPWADLWPFYGVPRHGGVVLAGSPNIKPDQNSFFYTHF